MDLLTLYKCLSEPNRIRILNLLKEGPLCVCQIQQALDEPQVKMSKHLGYMKERGLLLSTRKANWSFYEINWDAHPLVRPNIEGISQSFAENIDFTKDVKQLEDSFCP
ncbi:MAG: metalloregulator ArsR/SmtB family transcription factor [Verrucomicrobiota bacterium]